MRKLILGPLVALLAASLWGCGGAAPTATPVPPAPTVTPAPPTATTTVAKSTAATPATVATPAAGETPAAGTGSSTTTGSNDPKSMSILTAAGQAMQGVKSYHFSMEISPLSMTGEGDMTAGGDFQMKAQVLGMDVETISVGGKTYAKNPISNEWEVQEGDSASMSSGVQDPREMAKAWEGATGMEYVGTETLDGAQMDHIKFSIDPSKVEGLPAEGASLTAGMKLLGEVWVGQSDKLIHQMVMDIDLGDLAAMTTPEPDATPGADALLGSFSKMHMVMKLSNFNEPVDIKAPI